MAKQKSNFAGITLFQILAFLGLCAFAAAIIFPKFARTTHKTDRCRYNMYQIGEAIKVYAETSGHFPQKGWDRKNSCPIWWTAVQSNLLDEHRRSFEKYLKCPLSDTHEVTSYDISAAVAGKPWDKSLLDDKHETPVVIEKPHPSGSRSVCYSTGRTEFIPSCEAYPD